MSGKAPWEGRRPGAQRMFFRQAICKAVAEEMRLDPRVMVMGQDVGAFGGSYREFDGLFGEFGPSRVRDTPVAEAATVGLGVGGAAAGLRPLVSITYMDFMMLALDPLVNYGAKLRYKTGGMRKSPVVIKTTAGAKGQGVAHSQCIEAWLMGVPGLKVVAPATPADAYGLMKAALRDEGPVVYVDHKRLFPTAGDVPLHLAPTPIGAAQILRPGGDVTIATHAYMTVVALRAAEGLADEGISCEVIDLRSLSPLDVATVAASVRRTGRLLTLEEGQVTCGVGVEVAARVREAIGVMPTARLGALPAPVSSNPVLEAACIPGPAQVAEAIRALCRSQARRGTSLHLE